MTVLKSPYRRQELIEHLEALSDIEYQRKSWVENRTDAFDFVVHFFLDDTALVDDPEAYIGYFLVDETEARAVQKVALAIDYILEEHGIHLSDAEYIALEDWQKVVTAASEARPLVHQIPFDPDSIPD